jgi:hypothetical protein
MFFIISKNGYYIFIKKYMVFLFKIYIINNQWFNFLKYEISYQK